MFSCTFPQAGAVPFQRSCRQPPQHHNTAHRPFHAGVRTGYHAPIEQGVLPIFVFEQVKNNLGYQIQTPDVVGAKNRQVVDRRLVLNSAVRNIPIRDCDADHQCNKTVLFG